MTDTPEEQPTPTHDPENAQANYRRAYQRLRNLVERRAVQAGEINFLAVDRNLEMRSCELSAISNLLVAKGIATLDELYTACAVAAITQGNKIFAEINTPRVLDANGQKVNGS